MSETTTLHPCIVAGRKVTTDNHLRVTNPYTGDDIGQVCLAGPEQLEAAIVAAVEAFEELRKAPRHQRSAWLQAIADRLEARSEEVAKTLMAEAGKPIKFARGEVSRAITTFEIAAREAMTFGGQVVPMDMSSAGEGYVAYTKRVPAGPTAAISPFNFPLNLVSHKVAPSLAVGNPVILKPASTTPLTALLLAEVVAEAGVPEKAFSVLPMRGAQAEKLATDERIKVLTFTGSPKVGWHLKQLAAKKKVLLELGGNAPVIVHEDANLDFAAPRVAVGGYAFAGQVCISVQRVLVHRPIYDQFKERYVKAVQELGYGDPADENTICGPLIEEGEVERVGEWVDKARQAGASLLCGGQAEGRLYQPTVLENVQADMLVSCDEVFGPVTSLYVYDTFEEALEMANDPNYGLQAGVFTRDIGRILQAHDELDFGGVIVNDFPTFRVDQMPYGGVKDSGFGREGLIYAMEEMSEIRLMVLNRNGL
ncbi:MAG: aldehyde dehydrogenase family protein [Candidatus Eremiobacteraeota bacterium]|nr:aldehyde dehydrogenase family protein [Candidatus Eremiobacteraeota bacterium]